METKNVLILWGEAKPNFPVVDNPDDAHLQAQRAARVESARKFIMHLKALCASFECIDRDTCKVALPLASVDALKRARGYETFVAQVKAHHLDIAHLLWDERPREDITMTTPAPENPKAVYEYLKHLKCEFTLVTGGSGGICRVLHWKLSQQVKDDLGATYDDLKLQVKTHIQGIIPLYLADEEAKSDKKAAGETQTVRLSDRAMDTLEAFELCLTETPGGVMTRDVYKEFPMGASFASFCKRVAQLNAVGLLITDSPPGSHLPKFCLPEDIEERRAAVIVVKSGFAPPDKKPSHRIVSKAERDEFLGAMVSLARQGNPNPTRSQVFKLLYPGFSSSNNEKGQSRPEYNRLHYVAQALEIEGKIYWVMGVAPQGGKKSKRYSLAPPITPVTPVTEASMATQHTLDTTPPEDSPLRYEDVLEAVVQHIKDTGVPVSTNELQAKFFPSHPPDKVRMQLNYLLSTGELTAYKDGLIKRFNLSPLLFRQKTDFAPPAPPPAVKLAEPDMVKGLPYTLAADLRGRLDSIIGALEAMQEHVGPMLALLLDLDKDFDRYTRATERLDKLKRELAEVGL